MSNFPPIEFSTPRLTLRRPSVEDASVAFETWTQDPDVARYNGWAPHNAVSDTEAFFRQAEARWDSGEGERVWAIERREDGRLLGTISALGQNGIALGYVLAKPHWNQGFMTEAVRTVIGAAFRMSDVYRVWAWCDVDNPGSARVMEKAGMQFEAILRKFSLHPAVSDEPRDCKCYAIVR